MPARRLTVFVLRRDARIFHDSRRPSLADPTCTAGRDLFGPTMIYAASRLRVDYDCSCERLSLSPCISVLVHSLCNILCTLEYIEYIEL